jgi:hypothetical protein
MALADLIDLLLLRTLILGVPDHIQVLDQVPGDQSLVYLHNGEVLQRLCTLAFYNIQAVGAIVAVRSGPCDHAQWLACPSNQYSLILKMRLATDDLFIAVDLRPSRPGRKHTPK